MVMLHGFHVRSIPNHVCLGKLVVLDLSKSCLVDVWKGKPAPSCKRRIHGNRKELGARTNSELQELLTIEGSNLLREKVEIRLDI
ncbi:hypothetical protein NC651_032080 [Populus alba x Populus x berolinensis]|nr:hypothetical protein NC651_032080 [Populus alba x Populus x berolinensis]